MTRDEVKEEIQIYTKDCKSYDEMIEKIITYIAKFYIRKRKIV